MVVPGVFLAGLGHGPITAPNVNLGPRDVPGQVAGTTGGAISTVQNIGQAVGVALLGELFFDAVPAGYGHAIQVALAGILVGVALTFAAVFLIPPHRTQPSPATA